MMREPSTLVATPKSACPARVTLGEERARAKDLHLTLKSFHQKSSGSTTKRVSASAFWLIDAPLDCQR